MLSFLSALLSLLDRLLTYLERRRIEEAAILKAKTEYQTHVDARKKVADEARRADPDRAAGDPRLHDDGFRRD